MEWCLTTSVVLISHLYLLVLNPTPIQVFLVQLIHSLPIESLQVKKVFLDLPKVVVYTLAVATTPSEYRRVLLPAGVALEVLINRVLAHLVLACKDLVYKFSVGPH